MSNHTTLWDAFAYFYYIFIILQQHCQGIILSFRSEVNDTRHSSNYAEGGLSAATKKEKFALEKTHSHFT